MPRLLPIVLLLAGCDLFAPRVPEPPESGGGTWIQPSQAEDVVANLQAAVAEMNAQNYLRSLDPALAFEPAASARQGDELLWAGWGRAEEEAYFRRLQAAAAFFSEQHSLVLQDAEISVGEGLYVLNASYLLTVRHSEDAPTDLQGRLSWEITRDEDGLWRLSRWTDEQTGAQPTWSDLKAAFAR